jgi:hypothetical protein
MRTPALRATMKVPRRSILTAVPLVHPHALDPVHLAEHTGGVDETGDRAVRGFDVGDTLHNRAFAGDIERRGPQHRLCAGKRLRRDVCYHDMLALSGEQRRGRSTNAAAAAGDEDDTVSGHGRRPCRVHGTARA